MAAGRFCPRCGQPRSDLTSPCASCGAPGPAAPPGSVPGAGLAPVPSASPAVPYSSAPPAAAAPPMAYQPPQSAVPGYTAAPQVPSYAPAPVAPGYGAAPQTPGYPPAAAAPAIGGAAAGYKYCTTCGSACVASAALCTTCGTPFPSAAGLGGWVPKSKTTAVILAVFLTFWTWAYTYKANAGKFWAGLIICFVSWIFIFVAAPFFIIPIVWLWAVIDTATSPDSFYKTGVR